ncbi:hypothetical protein DRQ33_03950 [bacterium]|nr:MAG: hypothetical protein DRQ33_03950 [bacterium]
MNRFFALFLVMFVCCIFALTYPPVLITADYETTAIVGEISTIDYEIINCGCPENLILHLEVPSGLNCLYDTLQTLTLHHKDTANVSIYVIPDAYGEFPLKLEILDSLGEFLEFKTVVFLMDGDTGSIVCFGFWSWKKWTETQIENLDELPEIDTTRLTWDTVYVDLYEEGEYIEPFSDDSLYDTLVVPKSTMEEPIRVYGHVLYKDYMGNYKPLKIARVEIWSSDETPIIDDYITIGAAVEYDGVCSFESNLQFYANGMFLDECYLEISGSEIADCAISVTHSDGPSSLIWEIEVYLESEMGDEWRGGLIINWQGRPDLAIAEISN